MSGEILTLALDPDSGDILLDEDEEGNPIGGGYVYEDADTIVQMLKCRLQMFYGTWFLDTTAGVPYYEDILGKDANKPDPTRINAVLVDTILDTPGVIAFSNAIEYDYNSSTRKLSFSFEVKSIFGLISLDSSFLSGGGI
ncbi:MAG: hypothetical protein M0Q12_00060 [Synergistaceae bacterium]|jgi:hypothetical protein|nr:hypothetical protein [Synergistaceae bacterium]